MRISVPSGEDASVLGSRPNSNFVSARMSPTDSACSDAAAEEDQTSGSSGEQSRRTMSRRHLESETYCRGLGRLARARLRVEVRTSRRLKQSTETQPISVPNLAKLWSDARERTHLC